jgi:imidazolonepropionase-like amidohydrolase
MWEPDADRMASSGTDASGRNIRKEMYHLARQHVGQAHASGAKILSGTDVFDTYVFPGFSIHDELVELVAAGLAPAAALRTATIDAAVFSGVEASYGSIAVGKTSDMLLLNANPLLDISNTRQIDGLFFNGFYFDRKSLDRLLDFAEQQAGSARANLHILWDAVRSPLLRLQFAD